VKDDAGVVAIVVALCLLVLMAGVAFSVDVGGLLLRKRAHVTGADAAALAAAAECALGHGFDEAEDAAIVYAGKNIPDAGGTLSQTLFSDGGTCAQSRGHVSVGYSSEQNLYFAPTLGFDHTSPVSADATASWGPAGGSAAALPLVFFVPSGAQNTCDVHDLVVGDRCVVWEDNFERGGFGFIDLEAQPPDKGWDIPQTEKCPNNKAKLEGWIRNGIDDPLMLRYPAPTWSCSISGELGNNPVWRAIVEREGDDFDVPVVDGPPVKLSSGDKYNVIGFAHFKLLSAKMASKTTSTGGLTLLRSEQPNQRWMPDNVNARDLKLDLAARYPDATFVSATSSGGSNWPIVDGVLQRANGNGPNSITIAFVSETVTPPPECGTPPVTGNSSHCLVFEWLGPTVGSHNPGGGADFGVRAVILCDLTTTSCLDQR
jgi:Flp pilus assembly protein TadG